MKTGIFIRAPAGGNWIGLGFSGPVISKLQKNGQVFFLSWSQNYFDPNVFFNQEVNFFNADKMGLEKNWSPDLIPVTVSGPWNPSYLKDEYLKVSPFSNQEEVTQTIESWTRYFFPLFMWCAKLRSV